MRNTAVSFIAGSVFGGIVVLLISDAAPRLEALTETQQLELPDEEASSPTNLESAQELSRLAPDSQSTKPQPADSPDVADAAAANPDERLAELGATIQAANQEALEIGRARWLAELGPVISPVPLPPEFDWFGWSVFHEQMQREPIDFMASSKESQLTQYLISSPQVLQTYGTPTVRCNTNRCLVTWVSYGSSETEDVVRSDILALTNSAADEVDAPLGCNDPGDCFTLAHVEDGVATAIWGVKFEGNEVVPGQE